MASYSSSCTNATSSLSGFVFFTAWKLVPPAGCHCPYQVDSGSWAPYCSTYLACPLKLSFLLGYCWMLSFLWEQWDCCFTFSFLSCIFFGSCSVDHYCKILSCLCFSLNMQLTTYYDFCLCLKKVQFDEQSQEMNSSLKIICFEIT